MNATKIQRWNKTIRDANRHQTVWVKPQDIKGAICRDHQKYVIARALMRQLGAPWVDVGASTVLVGTSAKRGKRFHLTAAAKEQVRYFDTHDGAFAPCKLKLSAPPQAMRIGNRGGRKSKTRGSGKRQQPTR